MRVRKYYLFLKKIKKLVVQYTKYTPPHDGVKDK